MDTIASMSAFPAPDASGAILDRHIPLDRTFNTRDCGGYPSLVLGAGRRGKRALMFGGHSRKPYELRTCAAGERRAWPRRSGLGSAFALEVAAWGQCLLVAKVTFWPCRRG